MQKKSAAGILLVLALMLSTFAGAVTAPQVAAVPDTADKFSLGEFGECLSGQTQSEKGRANLVMLIDQSTSLSGSDPKIQRQEIANMLLDKLSEELEFAPDLKIDVQVAGFAAKYQGSGWKTLSKSTLAELKDSVKKISAPESFSPVDTDYIVGVEGALQDLDKHSNGVPDKCQAIVWFSDGKYEVNVRDTDEEVKKYGTVKEYAPGISLDSQANANKVGEAGKEQLCRSGGSMDQVRTQGVTVIGIGLSVKDDPKVLELMRNAITASGDCGEVKQPQGYMYSANNPGELTLAVHSAFTQTEIEDLCISDGAPNPECAKQIVLDDSIKRVQVVANAAGVEDMKFMLAFPGQSLDKAEDIMGKPEFHAQKRGSGTIEFSLDKEDVQQWEGIWKLYVASDSVSSKTAKAKLSIDLRSGLAVQWPKEIDQARAGEKLKDVEFDLINIADKKEIPASEIKGKIEVSATITDAKGKKFEVVKKADAKTLLSEGYDLDLSKASPGKATVEISTTITTADAKDEKGKSVPGTTLLPETTSASFDLASADNFPTLGKEGKATVDFGKIEDELEAQAKLAITGPSTGPGGCVWLKKGSEKFAVYPKNLKAGDIKIDSKKNSAKNCVKLQKGESGTIPLTLSIPEESNGDINGTVTVLIAPSDGIDIAQEVNVEVKADVAKPVNAVKAVLGAIVATFIGILIPLLVLYIVKFVSAKIPAGSYRYYAAVVDPASPHQFVMPSQSEIGWGKADGRRAIFGEFTVEAKMSWNPLAATRVYLTSPTGMPSVGSAIPGEKKGVAVIPQNINSQWIFVKVSPTHVKALVILDASSKFGARETWEEAFAAVREALPQEGVRLLSADAPEKGGDGGTRGGQGGTGGQDGGMPGGGNNAGGFQAPNQFTSPFMLQGGNGGMAQAGSQNNPFMQGAGSNSPFGSSSPNIPFGSPPVGGNVASAPHGGNNAAPQSMNLAPGATPSGAPPMGMNPGGGMPQGSGQQIPPGGSLHNPFGAPPRAYPPSPLGS